MSVSYAAVEEDGTSGFVIEVFHDSDKVCAEVGLLHGCRQSCMPNPVEGWRHFSQRIRRLKIDLLCGAPSCSEACLFFSDDLLCLWPQTDSAEAKVP